MLTHSQIAIFVQQTHAQTPFWHGNQLFHSKIRQITEVKWVAKSNSYCC